MDIMLVFKIILAVVIFCIVIFILRAIIANRKVRRIGYYSLEPLKDDSLSITDKIIDKYLEFIKKMRKYVSKSEFLKKSSKRYEKYIKYTNREKMKAIDFITNKIIIAFVFIVLTVDIFSFDIFSVFDYLILIIKFFLGYYLLDIYLYFYQKKQNKLISNELLRAIIIMNNAFKSGKSTLQAIQIASEELPEPISDEFKKMYLDMKFGLSVDTVFDRFAKRVNREETVYVSSSLKIFNTTGGNIVEVFSSIERSLFAKKKLREELKNISSSPIMTVAVLIVIPIAFAFLIFLFDRTYFTPLIQSPLGYIIIGMIVIMFVTYVLLLIRILKIEV